MCNEAQYEVAVSFCELSFQYLSLVQNVASQIVPRDNIHIYYANNRPLTEDEYVEATKWSDFIIVIPLLSNLYHGLELLVKGFLLMTPETDVRPNHSLQRLRGQFSSLYPNEKELNDFLRKYTDETRLPAILREFLTTNAMTFDNLYEALRYPSDPNFQRLKSYIDLMFKGKKGVPFFKDLCEDIEVILRPAVKLANSLKPKDCNGENPL
jgi:hypothetical protein